VHTHSTAAASWAQAGRSIPPLGTTHADHFRGAVPVTRQLREEEVAGDYELATGEVIVETLERLGLSASDMPAALVASHGPAAYCGQAGRNHGTDSGRDAGLDLARDSIRGAS